MAPESVRHPSIDFDAWRRDYDSLTYDQHVEFYRQIAEVYPDQQHYNEPAVRKFLTRVSGDVLELGGWKGELAAKVLPDFPAITSWHNVEIAPQAVTESACSDPRYSVEVPEAFLWNTGRDLSQYRTLVASHVLEHMKLADVKALLSCTRPIRWMYVDAPVPKAGSLWDGGESSHIIEVGWTRLTNLFIAYGFRQIGKLDGHWGPARWFER